MARTKTLDGKRNGWSVKLSDAKSDRADELRGDTPRALWLESLVDAAIASAGGMPPVAPERKRKPPVMHGQQQVTSRPAPKDGPGPPPPQPPQPRASAGTATAVFQPPGGESVVGAPVPRIAKTAGDVAAQLAALPARSPHTARCTCFVCKPPKS